MLVSSISCRNVLFLPQESVSLLGFLWKLRPVATASRSFFHDTWHGYSWQGQADSLNSQENCCSEMCPPTRCAQQKKKTTVDAGGTRLIVHRSSRSNSEDRNSTPRTSSGWSNHLKIHRGWSQCRWFLRHALTGPLEHGRAT